MRLSGHTEKAIESCWLFNALVAVLRLASVDLILRERSLRNL